MRRQLLSITIALLWVATPIHAQSTRTIAPDRPWTSRSALLVPVGSVQIETGGEFAKKTPDQWIFSYPSTLLRLGVLDNLELRVAGGYVYDLKINHGDQVHQGMNSTTVGAKLLLENEVGWLPQAAFVAELELPLGSHYFIPRHVAPGFELALAHSITDAVNATANIGAEWDGTSGEGVGLYSLLFTVRISEQLHCYAENFGELPLRDTLRHYMDAGVLYRPTPNFQLDASYALPFTATGPDYMARVGVSWGSW